MYNPNFVSDETLRERERQHHYQFNNMTPPKVRNENERRHRDDRSDRDNRHHDRRDHYDRDRRFSRR